MQVRSLETEEKYPIKELKEYFLIPVSSIILYGFIISGEVTIGNNIFHNLSLASTDFESEYIDAKTSVNEYLNYISSDPAKYLGDRFVSLWNLWGPFPSSSEGLRANLFFTILSGLRFPLLILAVYALWKFQPGKEKTFLICTFLVLTAVHFFFFSIPRFTVPVEPLLIILTVEGITKDSKFSKSTNA